MNNNTATFAQKLRDLRKKAGLSQIDFARGLAVSQPTVHHWEKGNRVPTTEKLGEIAQMLGVEITALREEGMPEPPKSAPRARVPGFAEKPASPRKDSRKAAQAVQPAPSRSLQPEKTSVLPSSWFTHETNVIRRVSFQGLEGAYSHQAVHHCFPEAQSIACQSFDKALDAVRQGEADVTMIPIENSLFGRVSDIHHLLPNSSLYIIGEYFLPIKHMLMGTPDAELHLIEKVISHPQALGQARDSLRSLHVHGENWYDTAGAAKEVSRRGDPKVAAVASEMAAIRYGLKILRRNVEDRLDNVTRFVIMSPRRIDPPFQPSLSHLAQKQRVLTSLVFTVRSIPAGLYKCIGGFATQGVNIIKLESYVPFLEDRSASFYAEIEGNPRDRHVQQALDELGFYTTNTRILGVYSAAPYRQQS